MKVGNAIKLIRKELKMTQGELSDITGISQTSLSKIEGGTNPSEKNLSKICAALKVNPSLLFILSTEIDDIPNSNKDKFKLLFPTIKNLIFELVAE